MVVVNGNNKNCWYAAGLHFECFKCGRCCSGPAEGYIWVSRPEIRLIAGHLKMSVKDVKDRFLKRQGLRMTIIEDACTRDCVFLQETREGKGCMVYPVRPAQCRSWPFWPSNLSGSDSWNLAAQRCPGINRGKAYSPEQIRTRQNTKHWWRKENNDLIQEVEDIYNWLDEQLAGQKAVCGICGRCCDFNSYDHRLYVTTPEIVYFADKIGRRNIKRMEGGCCSYQAEGICTVYEYRFAGCRIFCCKGDSDFQSDLTEATIKKFKLLCEEFQIPYRYVDLPTALNDFSRPHT